MFVFRKQICMKSKWPKTGNSSFHNTYQKPLFHQLAKSAFVEHLSGFEDWQAEKYPERCDGDGRDWCAQKQTENNFGCKTPSLRPNPKVGYLLILVELDFVNGVSFDNFAGK